MRLMISQLNKQATNQGMSPFNGKMTNKTINLTNIDTQSF